MLDGCIAIVDTKTVSWAYHSNGNAIIYTFKQVLSDSIYISIDEDGL